ncbi:MAG: hypothetical protein ACYDEN_12450 [Acidimicrobiales bacterium]
MARRDGPSGPAGEAGFVGGFEGLLFGALVFVVGGLLVAYAWAVVDTKLAVAGAARLAAREYVQASDALSASADAVQAAEQSLQGWGRDPSRAVVVVGGVFARCARVTVTVRYPAPLLELPWIGRLGSGGTVSAEQSELVDPFRSGLPGTATCG